MSMHDPTTALRQILVHAREVVEITTGKTRADLDQDRLLNLALTRLMEIIGEAANRVQRKFKRSLQTCPGCK